MKRVILLSAICLSFLTTTLFTSCDKESSDSNLDNPELVGKPYFTMSMKDTIYVKGEGEIKAELTSKGQLIISAEGLGKNGLDIFEVELLKLQEGNFPTNVNVAVYLYGDEQGMEVATSLDMERPDLLTGMVKITKVNKVAKVIDGSFDIKMIASPLNEIYKDQFTVKGEFENLPYERVIEDTKGVFVYAVADGVPLKDLIGTATHDSKSNIITVNASNENYKHQNLILRFPANIEAGSYAFEDFSATYSSIYGVKYISNAEDSALEGSYLKIDKIEDETEEGKTFRKFYGKFDFKLREDRGTHVLQMTEGEFVVRVEIQKPDKPPVIEL
jgi:hypothetical protein